MVVSTVYTKPSFFYKHSMERPLLIFSGKIQIIKILAKQLSQFAIKIRTIKKNVKRFLLRYTPSPQTHPSPSPSYVMEWLC